jgi:hypothetical protein
MNVRPIINSHIFNSKGPNRAVSLFSAPFELDVVVKMQVESSYKGIEKSIALALFFINFHYF